MNAFGVDVRGLDVEAFLAVTRHLFPALALAWLALLMRVGRPWWLVLGVVWANAYVWLETNWPLQRLYALGPSMDRVANLAMCQVVAAGNSPLQTAQVGQSHFEPFWGLVVAAVSGWDPGRVLAVYPFFPLVLSAGFAVAVYAGLRAGRQGGLSAWECALAAAGATLLSSSPLDFSGAYRAAWPMSFMLKPNHALGLIVLPLFLRGYAGIRGWRGRLAMGLLLHLLGWVFVIHMVYVSVGLLVFAAWSSRAREERARRDWLDAVVVIGINLLVVSPYLLMLFRGYPIFDKGARMAVPPWSAHLLELTTRTGWIFALAVWGGIVMARQGGRLGRLWVAQALAALIIWVGYLPLSLLELAKERDELYYWTRFLLGAMCAVGAWDAAGRAWAKAVAAHSWLSRPPWQTPTARAVVLGMFALPFTLPYWWSPVVMDPYFKPSLEPLAPEVEALGSFFRERTDPRAVVAGDRDLVRYVAALSGRRMTFATVFHLPPRYRERVRLEEMLLRETDGARVRAAAAEFGVRYLLVTPGLLASYPDVVLADLRNRAHLRLVHASGDPGRHYIAVFELA